MFKKCSKIDLVFLLIFFISLCLPIFNTSRALFSEKEGRRLNILPSFMDDKGKMNYNYGNDYEKWIKDHFWLRDSLISWHNNLFWKLSLFVYHYNKNFVSKKDHTFLRDDHFPRSKKKDIEEIGKCFQTFNNYLSTKGIKFYIITLPTSSYWLRDQNLIYKNPTLPSSYILPDALEKNMQEKYHVNHIDMTNIYNENSKEDWPVYKTEHHSTDFGYFLTYERLMKLIKKDFSDIKINTPNDFKISKNKLVRHNNRREFRLGRDHEISTLSDKGILDTEYTYLDYKNLSKIKVSHPDRHHHVHVNPNGKYKVLFLADSHGEGFMYFLNTSFAKVDFYRVSFKKYPFEVKPFYEIIGNLKPDVVIFLRDIGVFNTFKTMYPKNKKEGR